MKSMIIVLILAAGLGTLTKSTHNNFISIAPRDTCYSVTDIQVHKGKEVIIFGKLQKFTPWEKGKGSGHMFWDWEIAFPLGGAYPVISKPGSDSIDFAKFENQNVIVYATVYFGIVIGDSDPNHQSATGYRIDAERIEADPLAPPVQTDTCWIWDDIESNHNREAFVAGKLIEYVPPHDGSKLGDEKLWPYELQLADGYEIPLSDLSSAGLELAGFINRDVFVKAYIVHGIIFGRENTANIHGTRLDAYEIYVNERGYPKPYYEMKIKFDLNEFTEDGYRQRGMGEVMSINYEFCIPADENTWKEVSGIDATLSLMKGSKGRSGCSSSEWLCIGSSRQERFKEVIIALADKKYIRKITETFWE